MINIYIFELFCRQATLRQAMLRQAMLRKATLRQAVPIYALLVLSHLGRPCPSKQDMPRKTGRRKPGL